MWRAPAFLSKGVNLYCWFVWLHLAAPHEDAFGPIAISPLDAIVAGGHHACALMRSADVLCWGNNAHGQLGRPSSRPRSSPSLVRGLDAGVVSLAVGWAHSCALLRDGGVMCWGLNDTGALGDPSLVSRSVPARVQGLPEPARAIAAGDHHTCALLQSGRVMCWGDNTQGQLGDASTVSSPAPVFVRGLSGATALAVGREHACALVRAGQVLCWGDGRFGQSGDGRKSQEPRIIPVAVTRLPAGVDGLAAGGHQTCVKTSAGEVACWGLVRLSLGDEGELLRHVARRARRVEGVGAEVRTLTMQDTHACALMRDGAVRCWGLNLDGQLGAQHARFEPAPVETLAAGEPAIALSVGARYSCALVGHGRLRCWGDNAQGQLGNGLPPKPAEAGQ